MRPLLYGHLEEIPMMPLSKSLDKSGLAALSWPFSMLFDWPSYQGKYFFVLLCYCVFIGRLFLRLRDLLNIFSSLVKGHF